MSNVNFCKSGNPFQIGAASNPIAEETYYWKRSTKSIDVGTPRINGVDCSGTFTYT